MNIACKAKEDREKKKIQRAKRKKIERRKNTACKAKEDREKKKNTAREGNTGTTTGYENVKRSIALREKASYSREYTGKFFMKEDGGFI